MFMVTRMLFAETIDDAIKLAILTNRQQATVKILNDLFTITNITRCHHVETLGTQRRIHKGNIGDTKAFLVGCLPEQVEIHHCHIIASTKHFANIQIRESRHILIQLISGVKLFTVRKPARYTDLVGRQFAQRFIL